MTVEPFKIEQFDIGPMANFGYLIADIETKKALVVDPAWETDTIMRRLRDGGYELAGFLVTHAHYDHTNAIDELLNTVDVPVYANKGDVELAKNVKGLFGSLGRTLKPVEGDSEIQLGKTPIRFLHTPGHTPGSQCIKVGGNLLTGDTLFIGGCGRTDLPGGDPAVLYHSLRKIAGLSGDIKIWPGHDYGTARSRTISEEKTENPYLQLDRAELFIRAVSH